MALSDSERQEITLSNVGQSDCGVVALQALTGWHRPTAERRAAAEGWSPTGTPRGALERVLRAAGYTCETETLDGTDVVATFALDHDSGLWLIYTEDHVMALRDGDLHNSRGFWRASVYAAVRVTR